MCKPYPLLTRKQRIKSACAPELGRRAPLLLAALALAACSDFSEPEIIRSSANISAAEMDLQLTAEVHTHLGRGDEPDETHITLSVELYAEDSDGFYFNVELAKADELNVEVNGDTARLRAEPFPSAENKLAVYYTEDFETTDANTELNVFLSRDSETGIDPVSVTLLDDAAFSVSPADAAIPLTQQLSLEWTENEAYSYQLEFQLLCESADGQFSSSRVVFPNRSVTAIASPYTFNPSNFFTKPDAEKVKGCELHSSLFAAHAQTAPKDAAFRAVSVRSSRQHHVENVITLTEGAAE